MSDSVWTYELVERLRDDWALGISTAEIGRRLGFSKNAVVGKAHRLDLESRPSPLGLPNNPRSPEKCAQIDEMLRNGMPVSKIAADLHVGHGYVMERRNELGLPVWNGTSNRGSRAIWHPPAWWRPARNAKPAPSQDVRDRVVKLLTDGSANVATAAAVGLSVDEVRKIRKTIDVPKRVVEPRAVPDRSNRDKEFISRERPHHAGYGYKASAFGERFQFGKQVERRRHTGTFPSSDDIAAHIAARGVTMCPTAAVALTSATIAAQDRVALVEYRDARNAEWDALYEPRNKLAAAGRARASAMRR